MTTSGVIPRRVALEVLGRVERDGAYANLALAAALGRSGLDDRDRRLVTELVYGTLRRRRALDFAVDRFLTAPPPEQARQALRLGAYQLTATSIPDHAAVSATVGATPARFRGLVNAVLRRLTTSPPVFPDRATELSYPDWIVERLLADLGPERTWGALEAMDQPGEVTVREDGYTQDAASQWVAAAVGAVPGEMVLDLCAAPGGKATAMASAGAEVVAVDVRRSRAGLVAGNATRLGLEGRVRVVVTDGIRPGIRGGVADRVLVDAPCTGLGVLRRRPDARWRLQPGDVEELAALQFELVDTAVGLCAPGGVLVYSVCTLTKAESVEVADRIAEAHPGLTPLPPLDAPWEPWGTGSLLLPQARGTDGMCCFRWRLASFP